MKTKSEIIERLLNEKQITAEEAVTLLMGSKEKEFVYIPIYPAFRTYPYYPGQPIWYADPFPNYSITDSGKYSVTIDEWNAQANALN